MRAARIEDGLVVDLWEVPSLTAYEGLTLVEASSEVQIGWLYSGSVFSAPTLTSADIEELAAITRHTRNSLLTSSDWTQLPDSTVDKNLWATYRQALRDISAQAGFPNTITWPTAP